MTDILLLRFWIGYNSSYMIAKYMSQSNSTNNNNQLLLLNYAINALLKSFSFG